MKTTTTAPPPPRIRFVDWDHRPAILLGDQAFAVLRPGTGWVSVDRWDVGQTGAVWPEQRWRMLFHREGYHRLDLDVWRFRNFQQDNEPQDKPLPRKKDFDRAALACIAAQKARLAATEVRLPELPDDEAPPTAPP
jgi:hypothetical protein